METALSVVQEVDREISASQSIPPSLCLAAPRSALATLRRFVRTLVPSPAASSPAQAPYERAAADAISL